MLLVKEVKEVKQRALETHDETMDCRQCWLQYSTHTYQWNIGWWLHALPATTHSSTHYTMKTHLLTYPRHVRIQEITCTLSNKTG